MQYVHNMMHTRHWFAAKKSPTMLFHLVRTASPSLPAPSCLLGDLEWSAIAFHSVFSAEKWEVSMVTVDDYILGDVVLHERFRLTTEILGLLVSNAPLPVSMEHIEAHTGYSSKVLAKACASLWRAMLMRPDDRLRNSWTLVGEPSAVTLEDVFRCVIAQPENGKIAIAKADDTDPAHRDVDLLLMQATMAINQSVFKHLRQFSLDRLRVVANDEISFSNPTMRRRRGTKMPDMHLQPEHT